MATGLLQKLLKQRTSSAAGNSCNGVLSEVRFVRCLVNVDAVVGQWVILSCETSDDTASVDWSRNDEHLSRDGGCHSYEMLDSGRIHSLTILAASLSDEAKYACSCRDDVTSCLVLVEGRAYFRNDNV